MGYYCLESRGNLVIGLKMRMTGEGVIWLMVSYPQDFSCLRNLDVNGFVGEGHLLVGKVMFL